jgi:hypothetical protein
MSCPIYLSPAAMRTKSIRLHQAGMMSPKAYPSYRIVLIHVILARIIGKSGAMRDGDPALGSDPAGRLVPRPEWPVKPMRSAQALYRAMGFQPIPAYYGNPLPSVVDMALDL